MACTFLYYQFLGFYLTAGISGIVSKTIAAPIERVKLLLQTQRVNSQLILSSGQYKGPIDCVRRVYVEQGILSFWRGNVANLLRYFPNQAMNFAFKDQYKKWFTPNARGSVSTWELLFYNLLSGGAAGASSLTVTYPLEMARTRLATDVGHDKRNRKFLGTLDVMGKLYRANGIAGIYSGYTAALGGVIVFRALYLGGYDTIKVVFELENKSVLTKYFAAQILTTVVGTACYPLDTIRRRMMMQAESESGGKMYRSGFDCMLKIYRSEGGIVGFYPGLSVNLFRGITGGLLLVGYDEVKKLLG